MRGETCFGATTPTRIIVFMEHPLATSLVLPARPPNLSLATREWGKQIPERFRMGRDCRRSRADDRKAGRLRAEHSRVLVIVCSEPMFAGVTGGPLPMLPCTQKFHPIPNMHRTHLIAATLAFAALLSGAFAENIVFPADAGVANVKTDFGAKGDGITDDTAAIKKALDETRMKIVYFPNGTYLLSDSVGIFDGMPHSRSRFLQLQGQSEAGTILKLKDRSPAFGDPAQPKVFVSTYEGKSTGDAMFTNAHNMTVDVGAGNPGAVAFRYMTNNFGTMKHMTLRSSDPGGAGAVGLDLSQSQNGPGYVGHITVVGFDTGVLSKNSFFLVLEHIALKNQRKVGYDNVVSRTALRGLKVDGAPVAVRLGKHAELTLIEGDFKTAKSADAAIVLDETPYLLVRDAKQTGYAGMVRTPDGKVTGGSSMEEWSPLSGYRVTGKAGDAKTLRLPIEETPEVPWEQDLKKWAMVDGSQGEDVTAQLQTLIDTAAREGKTTICFPKMSGKGKDYVLSGPIRVHGSINRIIGMNNMLKVKKTDAFSSDAAVFTFDKLTSDRIVVERFFQIGGWDRPNVVAFENRSGKVIILRNLNLTIVTKKADPGGRWYLEDFCPGRHRPMAIGKGERVWARQFNPESPAPIMVHVDGGMFWCLGLKTEGRATHVQAENRAQVEILGGASYQSWKNQKLDPPMFDLTDSQASFTLGFYSDKLPFTTYVRETNGSQTSELKRADVKGKFLPVFRTSKSTPAPQ